MPTPSDLPRISVLGFSRFERDAFKSSFRLDASSATGYADETRIEAADFVIADGDDGRIIQALERKGLLGRTVAVGGPPRPGVLLQLGRPINPTHVLRALDGLPRRPRDRATGRVVSPHVERVLDELATRTATFAPDVVARAAAVAAPHRPARPTRRPALAPPTGSVSAADAPAPGAPADIWIDDARGIQRETGAGERRLEHILLVDRDAAAMRPIAASLQRGGFQAHFARSARDALWRVGQRRFEVVFVEAAMSPLDDGVELCRALKSRACAEDGQPSAVVLLLDTSEARTSSHPALATADGWLHKPVEEGELLRFVGEREVARQHFLDTGSASTLG